MLGKRDTLGPRAAESQARTGSSSVAVRSPPPSSLPSSVPLSATIHRRVLPSCFSHKVLATLFIIASGQWKKCSLWVARLESHAPH